MSPAEALGFFKVGLPALTLSPLQLPLALVTPVPLRSSGQGLLKVPEPKLAVGQLKEKFA